MQQLGLPLEYSELAEFFEPLCDDYNQRLAEILKQQKVKSVLDMTCGTGAQVFYLQKNGFEVTGSDISPKLLAKARERASNQKLDIAFIEGDVTKLHVGKFDAVITMFNAIGHLTKSQFASAIQNIKHNLKPGGLYIFDIFNLDAMDEKAVEGLVMDVNKQFGDIEFKQFQFSKLEPTSGLLTSFDKYTITRPGKDAEIYENHFTLQIYNTRQLQEMLLAAGFEVLKMQAFDGSQFDPKSSISILTAAKLS